MIGQNGGTGLLESDSTASPAQGKSNVLASRAPGSAKWGAAADYVVPCALVKLVVALVSFCFVCTVFFTGRKGAVWGGGWPMLSPVCT